MKVTNHKISKRRINTSKLKMAGEHDEHNYDEAPYEDEVQVEDEEEVEEEVEEEAPAEDEVVDEDDDDDE